LAHHIEKQGNSVSKKLPIDGNNEETEEKDVKAVIETKGARKEREKAEWERLSFIERIVKKYFPSQINSIAIFVNSYLL